MEGFPPEPSNSGIKRKKCYCRGIEDLGTLGWQIFELHRKSLHRMINLHRIDHLCTEAWGLGRVSQEGQWELAVKLRVGWGRRLPRSRKVQKPRAVQAIASSFLAPEKSNWSWWDWKVGEQDQETDPKEISFLLPSFCFFGHLTNKSLFSHSSGG